MGKIFSRKLGQTEIKSFPIGFGGIPIQRVNERKAIEIIREAVKQGINFFDTARAYTDSEEKIGKSLSDIDKKIYISTKTPANTKKAALKDVKKSLENLQRDKIDIYHLHNVSDEKTYQKMVLNPNSALSGLKEAKRMGLIEHIGITGHSIELLKKALKTGQFSVTMFCYNFIENECENDFLDFCRSKNIGMIAMKPFAGGRLNDASINLKYILQQNDVLAIPGMEKIEEVRENVSIVNNQNVLTDKERELMDYYKEKFTTQFCRRCGYCQPCPEGVNIPIILRAQSFINRMPEKDLKNGEKAVYKAFQTAYNCINCEVCIEKCPYNLPIPRLIEKNINIIEKFLQ